MKFKNNQKMLRGRLTIKRLIDGGQQADVYLAETRDGSPRALKCLKKEYLDDQHAKDRFHREWEAVKGLASDHIVRVYDHFSPPVDDQMCYLLEQEYMGGGSLEDRLEASTKVPWAEVVSIASAILRALIAVKVHKVVHRDIKPANILFTEERQPKLSDFGLSLIMSLSSLSEPGTIVGTVQYMPPEQAVQSNAVDVRADVYALGATMYRAATGQPYLPFTNNQAEDLALLRRRGEITRPSQIESSLPATLDDVIAKALALDRLDRYESPEAMLTALKDVSEVEVPEERLAGFILQLEVGKVAAIRPTRPLTFHDPLLGVIAIPEPLRDLVFCADVQRLDGIKQLSLVHKEYPSATHSRLSHSLGVAHLVNLAIEQLRRYPEVGRILEERDVHETLAAALLHDIGHGPLGHVMDEFFGRHGRYNLRGAEVAKLSHEQYSVRRITDDEYAHSVGSILKEAGLRPDVVALRAIGESPDEKTFLSEMVAGYGLDFDRLEYILRDCYFSGVGATHFNYDVAISGLTVVEEQAISQHAKQRFEKLAEPGSVHLAFFEDAVWGLITNLLLSRSMMYERVYHGGLNRAGQLMIAKALEIVEQAGQLDLDELMSMTDAELCGKLMSEGTELRARYLAIRVLLNRLYDQCEVVPAVEEKEVVDRVQLLKWHGQLPDLEDALFESLKAVRVPPETSTAILFDVPDVRFAAQPLLLTARDASGGRIGEARSAEQWGMMKILAEEEEAKKSIRVFVPPEWGLSADQIRNGLRAVLTTE